MKQANKTGFSNRLGFVMAAAGSAVGLGNIWRFPYLAAKYGGGIFLLVYLVLAVTFGFALMTTEIAIGRKTGKSAILAYKAVNQKFSFLGYIASAVPILIFPYYCVIGGWIIKYMMVYFTGQAHTAAADDYFSTFISGTAQPIVFLAIFLFCTALVVLIGVQKGIEKVSKILMPVLILLSLAMAIYALTLDGAMEGFIYYVKPNFSDFSMKTVVAAMGQLFFSLSIAMGIMITYGSYMRKEDNLVNSVNQVEFFDTMAAFLAGLIIIPAVVTFGGKEAAESAGVGLVFITLPQVFATFGGNLMGALFFVLVLFAAATSAISILETNVQTVGQELGITRKRALFYCTVEFFAVGIITILGYNVLSWVKPLAWLPGHEGFDILDSLDFISNNVMMPIAAIFTTILVVAVIGLNKFSNAVAEGHTWLRRWLFELCMSVVVIPCLLLILLNSFNLFG